mgnify:CR=1 FL=1
MKGMRIFKRQGGGYMSVLEQTRPELYKTIKGYRDRLDKPGEKKTFDKRANIQLATSLNMPKQMREAYYKSIEKQFAKPSEEQFKKLREDLKSEKFTPTRQYYDESMMGPTRTTGYYRDLSPEIAEAEKKLKGLTTTYTKTRQVPVYTYYKGASGPPGLAGSTPGVATTTTQIPKGSTYSPARQSGFMTTPAGYTSPSGQRYSRTGSKTVTDTFTRAQKAGDPEYDKQAAALKRLQTRHSFRNMPQFTGQSNLTSQNVYQQLGMAKSGGLKEDIQKIKNKKQQFSNGGGVSVRGTKFKGVF